MLFANKVLRPNLFANTARNFASKFRDPVYNVEYECRGDLANGH